MLPDFGSVAVMHQMVQLAKLDVLGDDASFMSRDQHFSVEQMYSTGGLTKSENDL